MGDNFSKGLAHGLAGLVGDGAAYDPLADARTQLSNANSKYQSTVNAGLLKLTAMDQKLVETSVKYMQSSIGGLQEQASLSNQIITDGLAETNSFLVVLALTLMILVFYVLLEKVCC